MALYGVGAGIVRFGGQVAEAAGVPGVSIAIGLLESMVKVCEEVGDNEVGCGALRDKCQQLLEALRESDMDGLRNEELRRAAAELELTLASALEKMRKWPKYSWPQRLYHKASIEESLQQCTSKVDAASEKFKASMAIRTHVRVNSLHDRADGQEDLLERVEGKIDEQMARMSVLQRDMAGFVERREHVVTMVPSTASLVGHPLAPSTSTYRTEGTAEYERIGREVAELVKAGIPTSVKTLDGQVRYLGTMAEAGGAFSDIWRGEWVAGQKVAIKAMRGISANDDEKEKARERFIRQLNVWSKLYHAHILPIYGISADAAPNSNLSIISPWQEHGNVVLYVGKHPDAPKLRLMRGAAEGLEYLHSRKVVHGNVRCGNILVSSEVEAKICDFGVSKIMEDITGANAVTTMTTGGLKNARWLSPELLQPRPDDVPSTSFDTDVWSFGMSAIECMTGLRPYAAVKKDQQFLYRLVTAKELPPRPSGSYIDQWMTDDLWALLIECWAWKPEDRPTMGIVTSRLRVIEASIL